MCNKNKNTGLYNTGHYNTGHYNSGDYNSGFYNTGHYNSGLNNTGHYNTGHYNSGDYNSGLYNTGHYNSGNYNTGHYNTGHYNTGFFNIDEPTIRMFGKDTGKKRSELNIPYIVLPTTKWDKLTGTLDTLSYKEAWKEVWPTLTKDIQQQFCNLPNFDTAIFKEITGIDVTVKENSCDGKVVEIDGKKYKLSEVK